MNLFSRDPGYDQFKERIQTVDTEAIEIIYDEYWNTSRRASVDDLREIVAIYSDESWASKKSYYQYAEVRKHTTLTPLAELSIAFHRLEKEDRIAKLGPFTTIIENRLDAKQDKLPEWILGQLILMLKTLDYVLPDILLTGKPAEQIRRLITKILDREDAAIYLKSPMLGWPTNSTPLTLVALFCPDLKLTEEVVNAMIHHRVPIGEYFNVSYAANLDDPCRVWDVGLGGGGVGATGRQLFGGFGNKDSAHREAFAQPRPNGTGL